MDPETHYRYAETERLGKNNLVFQAETFAVDRTAKKPLQMRGTTTHYTVTYKPPSNLQQNNFAYPKAFLGLQNNKIK